MTTLVFGSVTAAVFGCVDVRESRAVVVVLVERKAVEGTVEPPTVRQLQLQVVAVPRLTPVARMVRLSYYNHRSGSGNW
jgi:hypothetical protein